MAKQVKPSSVFFRVWCGGGAAPRIDAITYDLNDSTNADVTSYNKSGSSPATPADAHELTSGELTGTVQALLDAIENAIKTAEGIA